MKQWFFPRNAELRALPFRCPACQRQLAKVGGMQVATQVAKRTCPGCRARWQILVTPTRIAAGWVDAGEFTRLQYSPAPPC